jgi:hypothetical protein
MKYPVSGGLVLPSTWCEQIADDGHGANAAHGLSTFDRTRQGEYAMAPRHQELYQLGAKETEVATTHNAHTGPTQRSHNPGSKIGTP